MFTDSPANLSEYKLFCKKRMERTVSLQMLTADRNFQAASCGFTQMHAIFLDPENKPNSIYIYIIIII